MLGDGDPNKLTIEDVRDKLNNRFERIDEREVEKTEEQAFAAFKRQYKGSCTKCGNYGHKGANCPELRRSDSEEDTKVRTKFRGVCFHCGEKGHKSNERSEEHTSELQSLG